MTKAKRNKGYVVYHAPTLMNTRTITNEEWSRIGVEDQDTLHWGPENNWKVPAADVSVGAWPHIEGDSGFSHVIDEEPEQESTDDGDAVPESEVRESADAKPKRGGR